MSDNDSIQLGKFRFRSVSSNVEVFFQDEKKNVKEEVVVYTADQLKAEYQRGVNETTAKLQPKITQLTQQTTQQQQAFNTKIDQLTKALEGHLQVLENQLFEEVCNMGFTLAELILQRDPVNKDDLEQLILNSLREIHSDSKITVKLNPDDFNQLKDKFSTSKTKCESDPTLKPGETKIDHQHGYLDLTLKSRLEVLLEQFKNIRNTPPTET